MKKMEFVKNEKIEFNQKCDFLKNRGNWRILCFFSCRGAGVSMCHFSENF